MPEGPPEATDWRLGAALVAQWPSYVAYVMSFVVLGVTWASHHRVFQYIVRFDWPFLLLNLLFLLIVAFVPYPTALLAKYLSSETGRRIAVMFYGGMMTVFALTYNAIWWYASSRNRLLANNLDERSATADVGAGGGGGGISGVDGDRVPAAPAESRPICGAGTVQCDRAGHRRPSGGAKVR